MRGHLSHIWALEPRGAGPPSAPEKLDSSRLLQHISAGLVERIPVVVALEKTRETAGLDTTPPDASTELAATYAALILADDGVEITSDKILALTEAASIELEPIWASLLAKALEGKNVKELLSNVGAGGAGPAAAPAAGGAAAGGAAAEAPKEEEKKEEEKEESDDDMGFGLFD
ncbi:60s acidic ribosomal protein-domain-containing protein [Dichomitus squalens]|uniref:60s acidic ribosomal protein-domain-containing protein n=1 Tax=Dichomitus squalens TaxID=114155 RepID=A0A4Q9M8X6_9APHY|nr:60s acidic ribosomal protein-domain-containing protein [Dichomitus squalens]